MDDGLRSERLALPLAEAAARLGISAEALCRRLDRGEARGFERDGTPFVYLDDSGAPGPGADNSGAGDLGAGDLGAEDSGAGRRFGGAAELPADGTLPVVVEFQKMELTRLLRENERLNTRMDQLFDEIRHLRDMQQREQVLRQQEQALRRQEQETLNRLTSRPALPSPTRAPARADFPEAEKPRAELVLTRTVVPKRPVTKSPANKHSTREQPKPTRPEPTRPEPTRPEPTRRPEPGFLATGGAGRGKFAGPDRREPHTAMPKPGSGKPVTRDFAATPAPSPAPTSPAVQEGAIGDGSIGPEEAAELAMILNDIGHSLRDSEAFRRYPPITPGSVPQRAGDRRPASVKTPTSVKSSAGAKTSAAEKLSAEEAALAAIFDSMGPTAEDRRTAARNVRHLLRSRVPPPADKTE